MAGPLLQRSGGSPSQRYKPMADINVTPMVDVMLVLLVVFMVTAPLLTVGVPVDLPQTNAQQLSEPKEPLVITIDAQCKAYLQNNAIETDQIGPRLQAITNNDVSTSIYVRGDKAANYGCVLQVMGLISSAGFNKVSLVAEQPSATTPAPGSRTPPTNAPKPR
jgi:biopolymer transport protein TolR